MNELQKNTVQPDEWEALKQFTAARIALGSTGVSVPMHAAIALRLAHAQAKDAVYSALDVTCLTEILKETGSIVYSVKSKAADRDEYLQRPDLGRMLSDASHQFLQLLSTTPYDISIIVADGLSAAAVNINALPFIEAFLQQVSVKYSVAPIVLAEQGRVAIADEIGQLLNVRLTIILIGERPGLSAADSMGAYITFSPQPGNTDEKRNCISNIRAGGLPPTVAAEKVAILVNAAFKLQLTGVQLKDEGDSKLLTDK